MKSLLGECPRTRGRCLKKDTNRLNRPTLYHTWNTIPMPDFSVMTMSQSSVQVTVVMPIWRNSHTIGRSLDSLLAQADVNFKVLLVDDCCPDRTHHQIRDLKNLALQHDIRVITNDRNRGLAGSLNRALGEIDTPLVCFMHPDIVLPSRSELKSLIQPLIEKDADIVGHISARIPQCDFDERPRYARLFLSNSGSRRAKGFNTQFDGMTRRAANELMGFDADHFKNAGEDGDLLLRANHHGLRISLADSAAIHLHHFPSTFGMLEYLRKSSQYGNAQGALLRRHGMRYAAKSPEMIAKEISFWSIFGVGIAPWGNNLLLGCTALVAASAEIKRLARLAIAYKRPYDALFCLPGSLLGVVVGSVGFAIGALLGRQSIYRRTAPDTVEGSQM